MGNKHAGERTGAEELEKKSQRERITAHDTQILHNHGRVEVQTAADAASGLLNGTLANSMCESKLIDTSIAKAQRAFAESLKVVQRDDDPLVQLSRTTHFDVPTLRALREVFTAISCQEKDDDLISFHELCQAIGTKKESLLGMALFRLLDVTRCNQINFRAWVIMLSHLCPEASMDEKISFAFNLYDDNGDGYIDEAGLKTMLVSATEGTLGLNEHDATALIKHAFEQADKDNDKRINIHDYVQLVTSSPNFFESFTINIEQLLAKYNVITAEEVQARVEKLRDRDARQDEKMMAPESQAKDKAFMEREEDDLRVIEDVDSLDLE